MGSLCASFFTSLCLGFPPPGNGDTHRFQPKTWRTVSIFQMVPPYSFLSPLSRTAPGDPTSLGKTDKQFDLTIRTKS